MQIRFLTTAAVLVAAGSLAACGGSSTSSSGGGGSSDFCTQAQQVADAMNSLSSNMANQSGSPDLASFQNLMKAAAQAFDQLDSSAPSQISTSFHNLRQAIDSVASQVEADTSADQVSSQLGALNSSSLQTDENNVNAYMTNTCHITPAPVPTPSST